MHLATVDEITPYDEMTWREKIAIYRKRAGLNQGRLGELVGVSQSRVSAWESGTGVPDLEQAFRIARILGVTLEFLADDTQDRPTADALTPDEVRMIEMYRARGDAVRAAEMPVIDPKTGRDILNRPGETEDR